jgi:hypothetical protein
MRRGRALARAALVALAMLGAVAILGGTAAASHPDVAVDTLEGSGTAEDPYVITNASELQAMEDDLSAHYELGSDIDASGTAEWNGGSGFAPIGNSSAPFNGVVAGQQHTITDLTINRSAAEDVGLVGVTDVNARIKAVRLPSATVTGADDVGALVGDLEGDSTVREASMSGAVTGANDTGGLVGVVADASLVAEASANGSVTGSDEIGGLVGANVGGIVTKSASQATVTATGASLSQGNARAGGLVGGNFNGGVINHSYAIGDVSGGKAGGITGENYDGSRVANTYAAGGVTGNDRVTGGVIGEHFEDCPFQEQSRCSDFESSTVVDSYWDVNATGQSTSDGGATGLSTAEMTGENALENMTALSSDIWQSQADGYPTLRTQTADSPAEDSLEVSLSESTIAVGTETTLTVTVTDAETGDPIADATVSSSELGRSVSTDSSGTATLTVAPESAGDYAISISADGYTDTTVTLTVTSAQAPGGFDPVAEYGNEQGQVETDGLLGGIADWRSGDLTVEQLLEVIAQWRADR